jgi:hypothetical protein
VHANPSPPRSPHPHHHGRPHTPAPPKDVGLPIDLGTAHAHTATFLDPVLAEAATGHWNPKQQCWTVSSNRCRLRFE